jgi:hypothetical protein
MLNRPAARLGAAFVFPLEQGEPPSTEHGPDINALSRYALFVCKYLGESDVMMKAETLVVLGGAGFAKWAAGLPIASELFDSEIEPFGPRDAQRCPCRKLKAGNIGYRSARLPIHENTL